MGKAFFLLCLKITARENNEIRTKQSYFQLIVIRLFFRSIGYIPSNYVKEKELLGLQKYE